MCGRYRSPTTLDSMRELLRFLNELPEDIRPRYNAAPTDSLPVVRLDRNGNRELATLRWGLIPFWAEDAKIGYPPARIWGCPTTAMWVYRLGAEKAKRMLLTGDLIDGKTAKDYGLVIDCVPEAELDAHVEALVARMASVPKNQLMMQKLMVNQAYDNMGLNSTQTLATLFDGITRHSPEGVAFKARCEQVGFKAAVKERDGGDPLAWKNAR